MDDNPVRIALEELVKESGGQSQAADKLCITQTYVSQLLTGRLAFPEWLGEKFGYKRIWEKKEKNSIGT